MRAASTGVASTGAWLLLASCGAEYQLGTPIDVDPAEVTECAFESVEGRPAVQVYTCNPVFTTTDEEWAPTLGSTTFVNANVLGHPFYQVWYEGIPEDGDSSDWQLGYAVSPDGTTWTAHEDNPGWPERDSSAWDGGGMQSPRVAWDPAAQRYWLLYGGIAPGNAFFGVGLAGSRDGVRWETLEQNPVLSLSGPYDGVRLDWPVAFDVVDGTYEAWFAGTKGDADRQNIYRLVTDDITRWDVQTDEVFEHGDDEDWDDQGFIDAAVVELDGVSYLLYIGFGEWVQEGTGTVRTSDRAFVGLATREEGGEWERAGKRPLPVNLTEHGNVSSITAQAIGSRIHFWVTDWYEELGQQAVGYYLYDPALADEEER